MNISAAQARLHLRISSFSLPVTVLEGQEALSEPFDFQIEILVDRGFSVVDNLGLPGVVTIVGKDEIDPGLGHISTVSPIACALLTRMVGDLTIALMPGGEEELEVLSISYPPGERP